MATLTNSQGMMTPEIPFDDYNAQAFVIENILARVQTATLVEIVAVTNNDTVSPVGFVDVRPIVAQVDNEGNPIPHVTVYNVPYMRMQGGANAIILDPKVGDKGVCVFASRDITQVKKTRKAGTPPSFRKFSYADGLYVGGMLNGTPTQYVQFSATGIKIYSPTEVRLEAPKVEIWAGVSYRWMAKGYGEEYKWTGGNNWTHTRWHQGANVSTVNKHIL